MVLDGHTSDEEAELVVNTFQSAPTSDRQGIYQELEGHAWNGQLHSSTLGIGGDKLYRSLNSGQIARLNNIINGR